MGSSYFGKADSRDFSNIIEEVKRVGVSTRSGFPYLLKDFRGCLP